MFVAERQDGMTISLGHRVAVAAVLQSAFAISFQNTVVGIAMILFKPAQQGRPKVETDVGIVVYDSLLGR